MIPLSKPALLNFSVSASCSEIVKVTYDQKSRHINYLNMNEINLMKNREYKLDIRRLAPLNPNTCQDKLYIITSQYVS